MANVIKIKRSAAHDSTTAPSNLAIGELAYTQGSKELYICRATDNTGGSEIIHAAAPRHGVNTIITVGEITTGTWKADEIASSYLPKLNGIASPDGDVALNSKKITGLADPTDAQDASTKAYVDAHSQGLDVKESVRCATTGNIDVTGTENDLEAGSQIDGVTLVAGDRVLVKNQTDATTNGIYVAPAANNATSRAADFNENDEVTGGAFTFVEEGTVNADAGFVVSSNGAITIGTNNINFVQFSGAGQITAGDGLTKSGNIINAVGTSNRISVAADAIDIDSNYVGQNTITTLGTVVTGTWGATDIAIAHGGTGASDAAGARTNLGLGAAAILGTAAVVDGGANLATGDQIHTFVTGLNYITASSTDTLTNKSIDCGTF